MAAIQGDFSVLEFAPEYQRKDKDIVLAAVLNCICGTGSAQYAMEAFADEDFCNDKEMILTLVKEDVLVLFYTSEELLKNKEIVLESVKENGMALAPLYALDPNNDLLRDKDVISAAINSAPVSLQFVHEDIRKDKEVVLKAVKLYGNNLQFAPSDMLRNNKDIVLAAVKSEPQSLMFAPKEMIRDHDCLVAAGMFDEKYEAKHPGTKSKKIALSTRFSLHPESYSDATNFTYLLKKNEYIECGDFKVYAPNAFDKKTCDPNWTDFNHPCRVHSLRSRSQ